VRGCARRTAKVKAWKSLIARCYSECENVLDALELAAVVLVVALLLKRRKVDL
jgi:hypothetical protein